MMPLAPLSIVTQGQGAYFVKLVNIDTGAAVMKAYIIAGQDFKADVPLGRMELRYATGTTWYGEDLLFGPQTSYSKAESVLNFREELEGYAGYRIELVQQLNGNLETTNISRSEF